eukprot:superscaffoldBa00001581_g11178
MAAHGLLSWESDDHPPAAQRQPSSFQAVCDNFQQVLTQHRPEGLVKVNRKTIYTRSSDALKITIAPFMWESDFTLLQPITSSAAKVASSTEQFTAVTINKHKPWIETSYHGVITENMDTVLLDPPLVALDKDAPVPYA